MLSPESKGLLEMARSALGCSRHFAQGVDAIRTVVNDGGHQRIVVEHLVSCRFGRLAPTYGDGFYVFRVAPKGGNGCKFVVSNILDNYINKVTAQICTVSNY